MDIYYINIEEFLEKYNAGQLKVFLKDKNFKSEKRRLEYAIGRYLVINVAKKYYSINNPEIVINNKKPEFYNKKIDFSLTHSKNYVMAAFDKKPCGIDLEFINNQIKLDSLSKRYKIEFQSVEHFFEFWVKKEATIKLQQIHSTIISRNFKDNYKLAIATIEKPKSIIFTNFLESLQTFEM